MSELKSADINAQELENVIFEGKNAACCTIQLDSKPTDDIFQKINTQHEDVISAMLIKN